MWHNSKQWLHSLRKRGMHENGLCRPAPGPQGITQQATVDWVVAGSSPEMDVEAAVDVAVLPEPESEPEPAVSVEAVLWGACHAWVR